MDGLQRVRFREGWGSWNAGELAGFPPDTAAFLVAKGIAELNEPAMPKAPMEEPTTKRKAPTGPPKNRAARGAVRKTKKKK